MGPVSRGADVPPQPENREGESSRKVIVPEGKGWRQCWSYVGPGFLVAVAYIDPGNFESDLKAGAAYKFTLLWALLLASIAGLFIQSLSANLGIVTGKHLAQHCRLEYPSGLNVVLWVIAEINVIASDIPQVVGTAIALNLLFRIPLWAGVLITGCSALLLLALERFGARPLETIMALMVLLIAGCFIAEMVKALQLSDVGELLKGMVVPQLQNVGALAVAISILGATVMPHNLFLHSAIVLSRKHAGTTRAIRTASHYSFLELFLALLISVVINVAIISVAGAVCHSASLPPGAAQACANISISNAHVLLTDVLGKWAGTLFGVALLAAGQSSTVTGTYAGQYVMQGFIELRISTWLRNLITRSVAIVPALLVALLFGAQGASLLIILCSIVSSFGLPFALIPLLKFTSTTLKMGMFATHASTTVAASIVGTLIILANASLIIWTCVDLAHLNPSSPPSTESNLIRIIFTVLASLLLLLYLITLALLALRPISTATYQPTKDELAKAAAVAKAHDLAIDTYTDGGPGGDSKGGDSQGGERRDLEAGWGGVRSDGVRLEGAAAAESAESEAAAAAAGAAAAEAAEASAAAAAASALARSRASMTAGSNVAPGASGASDAAGTAAASFSASELSTNVAVSAATEASLNDWLKDAEKRP
ncbi:unnamed protein product [Closterium sp. NIES-53]